MDKINTGNWGNTFSEVLVQAIFSNDRYNESVTTLHEPGLATAHIRTISIAYSKELKSYL